MNTLFDRDYRALNQSELIYKVTNRREFSKQENMTFEEVLESLTPARREVAEAVIELYKRCKNKETEKILSSKDIYNYMYPVMTDLKQEEFWVVFINHSHKVIKRKRISIGRIDSTVVDVRLVLKEALSCCGVAMVVLHNHPSGAVKPSRQDDDVTEKLSKAGKLMEVELMDHVIFGNGTYYSYRDEGKL